LRNANSYQFFEQAEEALWQSQGHISRGKEAAIAGATFGYSAFFRHPSVAQRLVQQFHREVR